MTFQDDIARDIDSVFLDTEFGFATLVTLNGVPDIPGIFFEPFLEAVPGGTMPVSSSDPVLRINSAIAESAGAEQGISVVIDGTGYVIVERRDDGTGMTDLVLQIV